MSDLPPRTTLKKGDRVCLTHWFHDATPSNPAVGSEFECVGTVDKVGGQSCGVAWDNGRFNGYLQKHLSLSEKISEPNTMFKRMKLQLVSKRPASATRCRFCSWFTSSAANNERCPNCEEYNWQGKRYCDQCGMGIDDPYPEPGRCSCGKEY